MEIQLRHESDRFTASRMRLRLLSMLFAGDEAVVLRALRSAFCVLVAACWWLAVACGLPANERARVTESRSGVVIHSLCERPLGGWPVDGCRQRWFLSGEAFPAAFRAHWDPSLGFHRYSVR